MTTCICSDLLSLRYSLRSLLCRSTLAWDRFFVSFSPRSFEGCFWLTDGAVGCDPSLLLHNGLHEDAHGISDVENEPGSVLEACGSHWLQSQWKWGNHFPYTSELGPSPEIPFPAVFVDCANTDVLQPSRVCERAQLQMWRRSTDPES